MAGHCWRGFVCAAVALAAALAPCSAHEASYQDYSNFCVNADGKDGSQDGGHQVGSLDECKALCSDDRACTAVEWYAEGWNGMTCFLFADAIAKGSTGKQWMDARCYVKEVLCESPLVGSTASPVVPDGAIIASSRQRRSSRLKGAGAPHRARIDWQGWTWTAASNQSQWLQFDFAGAARITKVLTKGQFLSDEWVTSFQMQYSGAAKKWVLLDQVFKGNSDRDTLQVNILRPSIVATKIRIRPKSWHWRIAMRVELLGCKVAVHQPDELSCGKMGCIDGSAAGEGPQQDGLCSTTTAHSGTVWSQLYCFQRRYDELAQAAVKAALPVTDEVLLHGQEVRHQKETFAQDGFLALRGALSMDLVDRARGDFEDEVWHGERHHRPGLYLEFNSPGSFKINKTVSLRSAPGVVRKRPYRLIGIHLGPQKPKAGPWNQIFWHARLVSVVQRLLGGPARLLQALVFERGSQQAMHDDTWYLPGSDRRGGTVGVWVALDEVDEGNGGLFYYPGSHGRYEFIMNPKGRSRKEQMLLPNGVHAARGFQEAVASHAREEVAVAGWPREVFRAAPGDAAIWHERLLHGGSDIVDWSRTRRSLVMHYAVVE